MNKSKKKTIKVTDKTPANDPKGGGHGSPPKHINTGGGAKDQGHGHGHPRFNPN